MESNTLFSPVVDSAIKGGSTFVTRHSKYVFCFNTYVQNLNEKLHDLEIKRNDVEHHVEEGRIKNEEPVGEVVEWLNNVGEAIKERNKILTKIDKSKNNYFFCGTTVVKESDEIAKEVDKSKRNSLEKADVEDKIQKKDVDKLNKSSTGGFVLKPWTRWRISRKADKVTNSILGLEGKTFQRYTRPKYFFPPSRLAILQDINKALSNPNISIIGLCGPSGVGKSTLLDLVIKHVKEKRFDCEFDELAKATVSPTPNIERIQAELADWLGLQTIKEVNSVDSKAKELSKRLSEDNKKYLIILDDLSRKIELSKIGIPFKEGKTIKLLLTSRYEEVLQREMDSEMNFKLGPFEEEEAYMLFKRTLDKDINEDEETLKLIKGLLIKECAGLPLSINGLAIRLKSSPLPQLKDISKKQLCTNDLGVKNFINEMLKLSHDETNSKEVKSLFLLCGQIGSQIISVDKLVIYGMGLGIFKGIDTIQEARDKVDTLLQKLKSYCLIEDEKSGFIKIHDRISDVALDISYKEQHSLVMRRGDQLMKAFIKGDLLRCKSISLFNAYDIEELPQGLSCPELNMFSCVCTEYHVTKFKLPSAIFQCMENLKVLELFQAILVPLPQSIELLHQLQILCLDSCDIEDFMFLGKLKRLQVLIIRIYDVVQLPKEIAELTDLRVLDLSACDGLEMIEQGILGSLTNLEELLLPKSFKQWDKGGVRHPINASLTELSNMPHLSALQLSVPNITTLPNNLPLTSLMRYSLSFSDNFIQFNEARTLSLVFGSSINNYRVILEDFVQNASQKAQELQLSGWSGFKKSVSALFKRSFIELKHIIVQSCQSIEYIIDLDQKTQFPSLETLSLGGLANLKGIFLGSLLTVSFPNLKAMAIVSCESMRHLFSFSLVNKLSNVLKEIVVSDCSTIQDIVSIDVEEGVSIQADSNCKLLEFNALIKLSLENLPKLLGFCANQSTEMIESNHNSRSQVEFLDGRQVSFPWLESLLLSNLPGLRKVSHHQHPPNLQSLKFLIINSCNSLSIAIESKLLLMLMNLEVLTIESCDLLETVFELKDELSNSQVVKWDQISLKPNMLKLIELKSLIKIWKKIPSNISIMVNLKQLEIFGCSQLRYLFSSSMDKSLKNLSRLFIKNCEMIEGVFMEQMSTDENQYFDLPSLKELNIEVCYNINSFISLENKSGDIPTKGSFFGTKVLLPSLESLVLKAVGKFKSIWDSSILEQSFDRLTSVIIEWGESVTVIFPSIMVKRLQELKEVKVVGCSAIEVIFESGEENLMMSKLHMMELVDLPSLKHIVMSHSIPNKRVLGFPSLTDMSVENCDNLINLFDSAAAMTLSELKKLYISRCENMKEVFSDSGGGENVGWKKMSFDKLFSLELCDLNNLTHFCTRYSELNFPALEKLRVNGLNNFKAFIPKLSNAAGQTVDNEDGVFSPLFDQKVMLPNLQELEIDGLKSKEIWHAKFPSGSFCKLQVLKVEACHRISYAIPAFMLQNLEQLTVECCDTVETIFQLDGHTLRGRKLARSTACKLKKIRLSGLPNLHSLHKSESFPEYFPFHKLESIEVEYCDGLRNLFTIGKAKLLKKLEELRITHCQKMEVIAASENVGYNGAPYKIVFPQLSVLELGYLDELRSFCTEKHTTEWPSLKQIEIYDCDLIEALASDSEEHKPLFLVEKESRSNNKKSGAFPKLESIRIDRCPSLLTIIPSSEFLKISWGKNEEGVDSDNDNSGVIFGKLKSMEIEWCDNLSTIFPSTLVGGFRNLESLRVEGCECLKEVFQVDVGEGNNEESASTDDIIGFEKLRKIVIDRCRSLEHVFPASVARCLHQLTEIKIEDCESMEEIVVWKEDFNKHNEEDEDAIFFFPKLTSLTLVVMPLLKSFYRGSHSTQWPLLQYLEIFRCPTAKILSSKQQEYRNNNDEEKANNNSNTESLSFKATNILMTDMLQIPDEIIGNPTTLKIRDIEDEAFLWRFLLERPHNLQLLEIQECFFEEILPWPANREGGDDEIVPSSPYRSETGVLLIENITRLRLVFLRKLRHLWKEGSALANILDVVEQLEVWECPLLRGILCASSSTTCASASFHNLKVLGVRDCRKLRHVLTCSTARCLVHLTELHVWACDKLEEIVTHDYDDDSNGRAKDEDNTNADITFHRLSTLSLDLLPGLGCFSSMSCNFNFPCLVNLYLSRDVEKELFICKGIVRAPLLSEKRRRELGIQV